MLNKAIVIDRFQGLLVGTAVGDALGLPREGLTGRRAEKLFGQPNRHCFVFGKGMISDDTEHSIFVAQSLIRHGRSVEDFERSLAWALRWWLLSVPAGIGFATLRAILRSWLGFPPARSGVFSAGNGPAMRSAPIGAFFHAEPDRIPAFVRASSRFTHTDQRAEIGARAVAFLAAYAVSAESSLTRPDVDVFLQLLNKANLKCDEWTAIVAKIAESLKRNLSVADFALSLCRRDYVTGYVFQTVPVVVYSWFVNHGDFQRSVESVLECGGDADSTGAIIGALAGATVGLQAIPAEWVDGVIDWPRGIKVCIRVAEELTNASLLQKNGHSVPYCWPALLLRNCLFLLVVLFHGFRRLFPPY